MGPVAPREGALFRGRMSRSLAPWTRHSWSPPISRTGWDQYHAAGALQSSDAAVCQVTLHACLGYPYARIGLIKCDDIMIFHSLDVQVRRSFFSIKVVNKWNNLPDTTNFISLR